MFCGLHKDNRPHGEVEAYACETEISEPREVTKPVWVEEIYGVHTYLDREDNVYMPEDIAAEVVNPRIIGRYDREKGTIVHTVAN